MIPDWRDGLVTLLMSPNQADWEQARALKESRLPHHLYRYRSPSERSLLTLMRQSVWMSSASEFNDLHDTSVVVDMRGGAQAIMRRQAAEGTAKLPEAMAQQLAASDDPLATLDKIFLCELEKESGTEMASKAKDFFATFLATLAEEWTSNVTQVFQRGTKVACFCEGYDSTTLWAYYADSHKGFCVDYPIDQLARDDLRLRWLWPVIYAAERFSLTTLIDHLKGRPNPFVATLAAIHKAPEWAHEREWRMVLPDGDDAPGREILMPKPARIFLGSRMTPEYKRKVVAIAQSQDVAVLEMIAASGGEFGLKAVPLVTP